MRDDSEIHKSNSYVCVVMSIKTQLLYCSHWYFSMGRCVCYRVM